MFKKAIPTWKKMPSWLKWIPLTIATWFVGALLDSSINKEALFKSLFSRIPSLLLKTKIPTSILFLAFAVIAISVWRLNKRMKMGAVSHRRNLTFANNAYWGKSLGIIAPEGPFCPKCYANDKEVRMLETYEKVNEVKCPVCGLTAISWEPTLSQQFFGR